MQRKPWMEFEETEVMVKNEPSEQRPYSNNNKSWIETEQSSPRVLSQAPNEPARRTSLDRRQQSRPLKQAHVEVPRRSSKDRRSTDHSSSPVRYEFPELHRNSNNVNIETSRDYDDVLAHQNRFPEFKTPESFDMTFGSGNSLQTQK